MTELRSVWIAFSLGWLGLMPAWADAPVDSDQAAKLIRMVRQDCGACHGMRLTGGLGPALTPQAMREMPVESIAATIYHGRPGTPMPPWRAMINAAQAQWIAEQLQAGFPQELVERTSR